MAAAAAARVVAMRWRFVDGALGRAVVLVQVAQALTGRARTGQSCCRPRRSRVTRRGREPEEVADVNTSVCYGVEQAMTLALGLVLTLKTLPPLPVLGTHLQPNLCVLFAVCFALGAVLVRTAPGIKLLQWWRGAHQPRWKARMREWAEAERRRMDSGRHARSARGEGTQGGIPPEERRTARSIVAAAARWLRLLDRARWTRKESAPQPEQSRGRPPTAEAPGDGGCHDKPNCPQDQPPARPTANPSSGASPARGAPHQASSATASRLESPGGRMRSGSCPPGA